jgi:hypothetical protein
MFGALTTVAMLAPAQVWRTNNFNEIQRMADVHHIAAAEVTRSRRAPLPPQPDYQKLADEAKWEWVPERANASWDLARFRGDYQVEIVKKPNTFDQLSIRFCKEPGKPILALEGHHASAFLGKDGVLYFADFNPSSSGCALVAFDLADKKELWKTHLKGLGPIEHTKYSNRVALDFVGNAVKVLGHEAAGDYIEFVDLKTGKTAGHKIFRRGFGP